MFLHGVLPNIVYLFFVAIPYIFQTIYGFNLQCQGLAFLGLVVGMVIMISLRNLIFDSFFCRLVKKNGGGAKPEYRFYRPFIGGVYVVPVALSIVAWTSYSHLHWICPIPVYLVLKLYSFSVEYLLILRPPTDFIPLCNGYKLFHSKFHCWCFPTICFTNVRGNGYSQGDYTYGFGWMFINSCSSNISTPTSVHPFGPYILALKRSLKQLKLARPK